MGIEGIRLLNVGEILSRWKGERRADELRLFCGGGESDSMMSTKHVRSAMGKLNVEGEI